MKTTAYGKGPRGKATRLHSLLIRSRGRCENCGKPGPLDTAHIIPRRYAATRTDEANAFCLCKGCHMRFTEHADERLAFVERQIGMDEYRRLKAKAEAGVKANESFWLGECARLQSLLPKDAA